MRPRPTPRATLLIALQSRRLSAPLLLSILCVAPAAHAQSTTTTTLTITSGGSAVATVTGGSVVVLTATVTTNGTAVNPGQVNFCDATAPHCTDIHLLGTAQLTTAGTAVMKFVPGAGSHSYRAIFLGTTGKAASSSSAMPLAVTAAFPTTTTIASRGSPGAYILTATVTGTGGTTPPTGTVSFLDTTNANYILQTAPLVPVSTTAGLSFLNSSSPATNPYPQAVATADFNGDGILDLAVPVYSMYSPLSAINVLLGNGDGTFSPAPTVPLFSANAGSIAVADFNGDGKPDMVVTLPDAGSGASGAPNEMQVMLGNGDGTFTAGQNILIADPYFVTTGDFNGDGIPDLAVAIPATSDVTILLGNGDGTFTIKSTASTGQFPSSIAVADFNADGIPDLAVVDYGTDNVSILMGNGDGTFTTLTGAPLRVGGSPESVVVADFNGDGIADLAVSNSNVNTSRSGTVTILLGNGDGTFTQAAVSPATDNLPYSIAAADFNGDGNADLVTANVGGNAVSVLLGNGDGTFAAQMDPPAGIDPLFAAVGDFNGDGLPDIAAADNSPVFSVTILLSQLGAETATAIVGGISPVGIGTHQIDASYSGDPAYSPGTSSAVGLTAEQVPTTLTLNAAPTTAVVDQQVVLTATLAPDTAQNHNASGVVTFTDGSATVGTGSIIDGVATLNITSLPSGTDNLTASYAGDSNFLPSASTPVAVAISGGDFTITLASPSLTLQTQHHLTTTVTLASINTFADTLTLTCASLPAYITCRPTSPTTALAANGTATASLYLDTDAVLGYARNHPAPRPGPTAPSPIGFALLLSPASLFAAFRIRRNRLRILMLFVATIPFTLALGGCGSVVLPTTPGSTAPGTYTIPITATATSGLAHTANLTLTVTP